MRGQPERVCAGMESLRLTPRQARRLFRGRIPGFVGRGSRACAYNVGSDVIKITSHEPDAAAALAVKRHPVRGTLRVLDVNPVGDFYYAIRSKRVPAPGLVASVVQTCASSGRLDDAFLSRQRADQRTPAPVPATVVNCLASAAPRAGVSTSKAVEFTRELSAAQARLSNATGIHWFDVHSRGNFSQDAAGHPVIIDMGQSTMPARYKAALKRAPSLGYAPPSRTWHMLAEGLALAAGVPVMLAGAARLHGPARTALVSAAFATAAIDAWFIGRQA